MLILNRFLFRLLIIEVALVLRNSLGSILSVYELVLVQTAFLL